MKIAVHLRRCQSTAWTATDCNADARAKIFVLASPVLQVPEETTAHLSHFKSDLNVIKKVNHTCGQGGGGDPRPK